MRNRILCNILWVLLFCSLAGSVDAYAGWTRFAVGQAKEGRVAAIAADTYVIDVGISIGARVGEYYLVHYDGGNVHDSNGVLLGVYKVPVAVLRVRETAPWESFCDVVAPSRGWVIQRGDGVVSIAESDAHELKFATFRTTPGKPYFPGYVGRWARVSTGANPVSTVVKYNTYWTLPGLSQGMPPSPPGFYYMASPAGIAPAAPAPVTLARPGAASANAGTALAGSGTASSGSGTAGAGSARTAGISAISRGYA